VECQAVGLKCLTPSNAEARVKTINTKIITIIATTRVAISPTINGVPMELEEAKSTRLREVTRIVEATRVVEEVVEQASILCLCLASNVQIKGVLDSSKRWTRLTSHLLDRVVQVETTRRWSIGLRNQLTNLQEIMKMLIRLQICQWQATTKK